ncbi:putative porin [Shewanella sedimentimangrovi]|uniref:Porin n=2 Tax=Shewanella sedimentimangrovi TaxID=2814293 RepID=A0ABX7R5P9_9GAMM|nr:putative porin [Shewanella sedimentimangrovi]
MMLASGLSYAAADVPFQHEASVSYGSNTDDFGDGSWNLGYRFYASPVSQEQQPYALSGFLAQTSNLGAGYTTVDDADLDAYHLDGQYVFGNKWFLQAGYDKVEFGSDFASFDTHAYSLGGGYYFNDHSAAFASYSRRESDSNQAISGVSVDSYGLGIRSFIKMQSTAGVDLQLNLNHSRFNSRYFDASNSTLNLNADWYLTRAWSIGGHYSIDEDGYDNYGLQTAYWLRLSDNISLTFALAKTIEPDGDGMFANMGLNGRF